MRNQRPATPLAVANSSRGTGSDSPASCAKRWRAETVTSGRWSLMDFSGSLQLFSVGAYTKKEIPFSWFKFGTRV